MQFIIEPQRPFMLAILNEVCRRPVGICLQMESEFERGCISWLDLGSCIPDTGSAAAIA